MQSLSAEKSVKQQGEQRFARMSQVLKENLTNVPHFGGCAWAVAVCRVTSHLSFVSLNLDTIFCCCVDDSALREGVSPWF